jgi:hypothetical protein
MAGVADLSFNFDNEKALIDNWLALFVWSKFLVFVYIWVD